MKNKKDLHSQNETSEKRILVVDDNRDFAESLLTLLGLNGYVAETVFNAEDACNRIQDFDAHLALIDVRLGRSNGINLIPKFKSVNPKIVCVSMTAYADIDTSIQALKEGAYDYLQKPFKTLDLFATLDRCFERIQLGAQKSAALWALQESEERYHSLIANIPSVTWITNSKGETSFISPNIEKIYGFTSVEICEGGEGLWFGRIHTDDVEMVKKAYSNLFKEASQFDVEYRIKRKDGEWIWLHDMAVTTYQKGEMLLAYGVFSDITERKTAEIALRESENRYKKLSLEFNTLLDAIDEPIIQISPDLKILWANRSAALLSGREMSSLQGQPCNKMQFNRTECGEDCPTITRCFETGEVGSTQFSTSDGKLFNLKAFPVKDENGKVNSVIEIYNDITKEMTLQEESMRASQLASVGELAASVAHEINNPIYGITMCAQSLLIESRDSKVKDHDIVKMILKESERIANVTKCLLSFVRDSGDSKSVCNIHEIISDTLTITGVIIRKEGIDLKIETPKDLPQILAFPQKIQQVFLNLINNARYTLNEKYSGTQDNKILEIIGREETIDGCQYSQIIFYDRGMGIAPDKIDKILNPFFTTKPRGQGTGLGLSICNKIVRDHDGNIEIDSVEGEYTKFIVTLPAATHKNQKTTDSK